MEKAYFIQELKKRLIEISNLSSVLALLSWDQNVNMPKKAVTSRAFAIAEINSLIHSRFLAIDKDNLLSDLKKEVDEKKIKGGDSVIISETWKSFTRAKKLPESFVRELAETTSRAHAVWVEAREKNDFNLFLPVLSKIVELKKKEATYAGYTDSPYDALLDAFEPDMISRQVENILRELKNFLIPFLKKIKNAKKKPDPALIKGFFPIEKQASFNEMVVKKIGFDLEAGRIDKTVHPFATTLHPLDVRITTRYAEDDVLYSLGSIIHEAGHGLYEQSLPVEYFGTPLGESISLGIHESQSRMWENLIGKSKNFWKYFYPKLQETFPIPFKKISLENFYQTINAVFPSPIRTEADEVTYNLHIILRFEIEKDLIEGKIETKDLPRIWKSKMKEYLGIENKDSASGVLQDVHWSEGLFGYFPTYTLGNLYASQFYATMKKEIPDINKKISSGDFQEIKEWLKKNIHIHGKFYTASSLTKKVTGEDLNSKYFIDYLKEKYTNLFGLEPR